jgi:predicted ArsR family transcriptional regulator
VVAGPSRVALSGQDALLQRQARALGDPTRFRIFRHVADAGAPVRVAELTKHFHLNHNAIRQHLTQLCAAGLLVEEVAAPAGSGRPPLQYRLAPDVAPTWAKSSPYEQLSLALLAMQKEGRSAREVGAEAAQTGGLSEAPTTAEALERLETEVANWGFEPRRVVRGRRIELVMERCPFEAAASVAPEVVCEIHLGLAEGLAESLGGQLEVRELVAHNPTKAGCRLRLQPSAD